MWRIYYIYLSNVKCTKFYTKILILSDMADILSGNNSHGIFISIKNLV